MRGLIHERKEGNKEQQQSEGNGRVQDGGGWSHSHDGRCLCTGRSQLATARTQFARAGESAFTEKSER